MRILCLWVVKYLSGSTSERFVKPLEALGHKVTVMALEEGSVESRLIDSTRMNNYDVLLHLPYPNTVRMEVIQHLPIKTIAWCGDDEWFWQKYPEHARAIERCHDYCITTYKPALEKYRSGILASWGYSSDWKPKKVKKDIDIYFCGSRTKIRDQYLNMLKDSGLKILIEGPGYSGKIRLENMIDHYRRAKIGLSFVTDAKDKFVYQQVKARSFEIPAVKTFQLSEYCEALTDHFKNNEIIYFRNERELFNKCKYFLKNDREREEIAIRIHNRSKKYSYESIFKKIFKEIKNRETLRPDQVLAMNPHQREIYEKA